jgi:hypothetical protein
VASETGGNGFYLVGELLGVSPGKVWTDREGQVHEPFVARVLAGEYVEAVEFETAAAAAAAIGTVKARERVTLRIRVRGSWDSERRRFGRVALMGARD